MIEGISIEKLESLYAAGTIDSHNACLLFDAYWKEKDPQRDLALYNLIIPFKNRAPAMARLARMYRDGRGVESSETRYISLMQTASNQSYSYACELFDYYWNKKKYTVNQELADVLIQYSHSKREPVLKRIALMYLHGWGIKRDYKVALEIAKCLPDSEQFITKIKTYCDLFKRSKSSDCSASFDLGIYIMNDLKTISDLHEAYDLLYQAAI